MVKRKLVIVFFITVLLTSCGLLGIHDFFDSGYVNEHNQYVPKQPNFKLKDKRNNQIPTQLDTINLYRLVKKYQGGIEVYPNDKYNDISVENQGLWYIKFYPNGRCLSFFRSNVFYKLQENDLNPNNENYSKDYYYSKDGKKIKIESFVYGEGYGMYISFDYFLNEKGDTLTNIYEPNIPARTSVSIYVKQEIPKEWKKYPVDW